MFFFSCRYVVLVIRGRVIRGGLYRLGTLGVRDVYGVRTIVLRIDVCRDIVFYIFRIDRC